MNVLKGPLTFLLMACLSAAPALAEDATVVADDGNPRIAFGAADLRAAVKASGLAGVRIVVGGYRVPSSGPALNEAEVWIPDKAESFSIVRTKDAVQILGSDDVGAMYGCLELAERLRLDGAKALDVDPEKPIVQSPFLDFRAVNPFLTLPYGSETLETWWFLQEDFWRGYLDMLARARINWLDLHGMYDIQKRRSRAVWSLQGAGRARCS